MGHIKTLKLAKQFIKAQGGYTVAEVEQHYLSALRAAKTPVEYAALLEEGNRVKAGWVAPWMEPANTACTRQGVGVANESNDPVTPCG